MLGRNGKDALHGQRQRLALVVGRKHDRPHGRILPAVEKGRRPPLAWRRPAETPGALNRSEAGLEMRARRASQITLTFHQKVSVVFVRPARDTSVDGAFWSCPLGYSPYTVVA